MPFFQRQKLTPSFLIKRLSLSFLFTFFCLSLVQANSGNSYAAEKTLAPGEVMATLRSERENFRLVRLAQGLKNPWGMVFLPDQSLLITERGGQFFLYKAGHLEKITMPPLPDLHVRGQGGLLDVTLHPDFATNHLIYFTYSHSLALGSTTAVARARLEQNQLRDVQTIFIARTDSSASIHFGSRLLFDRHGYLFVTIGDRGNRDSAQQLTLHSGKVLRLTDEGKAPPDNPFSDNSDALAEIFSLGHRNPQGLALHPDTGELWLSEHGPKGGDEINQLIAGANYGWPVITYGEEYSGGTIGNKEHPDMQQPRHQWTPSIAPAGITFYNGTAFPGWRGDLLTAALKFRMLVRQRYTTNGDITEEEQLIPHRIGRIRAISQGPDDLIYLLSDESKGGLYRLEPLK
ncbi:PQQ-dependent sugar dehydrogenase [Kiloniella laminariae]|uniref:PQQ-dependent sugar dehydrogenase n=1 Tax=Kiloniella laminariae TaxID=454162 RepID=A0ABT4LK22_9PROT|nr:PQQ-dependent sugar dehydrogenase [Kiloniella laminariae]MCZ4281436.1 PQQ-dependent sugar dehydrogenase [Kiloniella laminariae]